jgi:hypothetical protein
VLFLFKVLPATSPNPAVQYFPNLLVALKNHWGVLKLTVTKLHPRPFKRSLGVSMYCSLEITVRYKKVKTCSFVFIVDGMKL